jgi:biopolymer transport protein ExbD
MSRSHNNEECPEIVIPVTPMLDMTFQLLAFFILTFKPASAVEAQLDFSLPATGEARAKSPDMVDPDRPSDTDLAPKGALTVSIKSRIGQVGQVGDISDIVVQMPNGSGERSFTSPEDFGEYLKRARDEIENKTDIQIQADSNLKYARVIRVMDICRSHGFTGVGFAPPADQPAGQ